MIAHTPFFSPSALGLPPRRLVLIELLIAVLGRTRIALFILLVELYSSKYSYCVRTLSAVCTCEGWGTYCCDGACNGGANFKCRCLFLLRAIPYQLLRRVYTFLPHVRGRQLVTRVSNIRSWHGQQHDGADPVPVAARGSDALEKRRTEKMLIARMLDMDEPFMTEKVKPVARRRSALMQVLRVQQFVLTTAVHVLIGVCSELRPTEVIEVEGRPVLRFTESSELPLLVAPCVLCLGGFMCACFFAEGADALVDYKGPSDIGVACRSRNWMLGYLYSIVFKYVVTVCGAPDACIPSTCHSSIIPFRVFTGVSCLIFAACFPCGRVTLALQPTFSYVLAWGCCRRVDGGMCRCFLGKRVRVQCIRKMASTKDTPSDYRIARFLVPLMCYCVRFNKLPLLDSCVC